MCTEGGKEGGREGVRARRAAEGNGVARACGATKSLRHATSSSDPAVNADPRSPPATPRIACARNDRTIDSRA